LIIHVFELLDRLRIPAMLSGAHASGIYGAARSTHDIDIVIQLSRDHVEDLIAAFPAEEFYVSRIAVEEAIREERTFNVVHYASGEKIDFWMLKSEPFSQSAFARRRQEPYGGRLIPVSSPEDTIVQKLRWFRLWDRNETQMSDARSVFEIQYPHLDLAYIEYWIAQLGLDDLWQELRSKAEIEPV
jgi:hypothetical protein